MIVSAGQYEPTKPLGMQPQEKASGKCIANRIENTQVNRAP